MGTGSASSGRATVLIIEPSALLRRVICEACTGRGAAFETAADVGEALTAITEKKPTAVLTALESPGLWGVSLIAALKSCPYHRAIPIGLLTSGDLGARCPGAYQPDAVIKKGGDLPDSVVRFLTSFGIGRADSVENRLPGERRLSARILLAEDSSLIHRLIGRILHVAGAEVMVVENGVQAVAAAVEQPFDLVLMDIEMPEMDGREATKRLRAEGIRVPILALTAHDADDFRDEAADVGFDDVVTKPVARHVLIDACAKHLAPATRKSPKRNRVSNIAR